MKDIEEKTKNNYCFVLTICIAYSGRDEISEISWERQISWKRYRRWLMLIVVQNFPIYTIHMRVLGNQEKIRLGGS